MNFFRAFFSSCSGPYAFLDLRKQGWWRVVLHLLIGCIIFSAVIGIGNAFLLKYRWRAAFSDFNEIFGEKIFISENGIVPEYKPEVSRRQELPFDTLLVYVSPSGAEKSYPDTTLYERNVIIVWSSAAIVVFVRQENKWFMMQYMPEGTVVSSQESMSFGEMQKEFMKVIHSSPSDKWLFPEGYDEGVSSKELFSFFRTSYVFIKTFVYFIGNLFIVLLMVGIFSCVFSLVTLFTGRSLKIPMSEIIKSAFYAVLPVQAAVCLLPALQLPGAEFFIDIMVIGWLIYLFVILRYLFVYGVPAEKIPEREDHE